MAYMFYSETGITLDNDGNDTENMQILDIIYGCDSIIEAVNEFNNNHDIGLYREDDILIREIEDDIHYLSDYK